MAEIDFPQNNPVRRLLDKKLADMQGTPRNNDTKRRGHLGASLIGRKCERELWYGFRWADRELFSGRMLRLFDRGHEEEFRFVDWLELVGAKVEAVDPETGKQFRFLDCMDHFAGSMDGKATNVPGVEILGISPEQKILAEFKTHGAKSFEALIATAQLNKGRAVETVKPEHYAQMIIYMDAHDLPLAIYCAVNKNTDELFFEFVMPNPGYALKLRQKANEIIHAKKPPPRINNSASWFECRFCTFKPICHYGHPMAKNCRTCRHSSPVDKAEWHCALYGKTIPRDAEAKGCPKHQPIED